MSQEPAKATEIEQLRHERDLYRSILELGNHAELGPMLESALELVVASSRAKQGYLELYGDEGPSGPPKQWQAHACTDDQVHDIRQQVSRGIISEALSTGSSIRTASAMGDPRFEANQSVRRNQLEAVVCVPVGSDRHNGVLYLQGHTSGGTFTDADVARAEAFAGHLAPMVQRLMHQEVARHGYDATLPYRERMNCSRLIGRSRALAQLLDHIERVARVDTDVYLHGAPGTEITMVARTVHDNSAQADGPFQRIDAGGSEVDLDRKLFGPESTRATRRTGAAVDTRNGTLLIDNVQDLTQKEQVLLLSFLRTRVDPMYPSDRKHSLRVICASHLTIAELLEAGISEDLCYRLGMLTLRIPTLADRRRDVEHLANHLIGQICARHDLAPLQLAPIAARAAADQDWEENLETLTNRLEAAVFNATRRRALIIELDDIFPKGGVAWSKPGQTSLKVATHRFKRQFLIETLKETGWNFAETARRLSITRAHVYNLVNSLGVTRKDVKAR